MELPTGPPFYALPANIRVGLKGSPETNTLAYLHSLSVGKKKKFYSLDILKSFARKQMTPGVTKKSPECNDNMSHLLFYRIPSSLFLNLSQGKLTEGDGSVQLTSSLR